jgi:hypothetical protein
MARRFQEGHTMTTRNRCLCCTVALGALVALAGAFAVAGAPEGVPPEMAEMMKLAQPGDHHKHMAKMVGNWTYKGKFWMAPGAPPEEGVGTMTAKPALDGRFIMTEVHSTTPMMGMNFHGMGFDGYDNMKQKHVGTWADNMGTMIMHFEGTCSDGGKVQEMKSVFEDPMTKKPSYMREVFTWKDERTVVMEAFVPGPDGKEMKAMEIVYTRA